MPLFVKICGLTRREDAAAAVAAGAHAIGLVAWPRSPRHATPAQAAAIIAGLPSAIRRVGVFVDPTMAEISAYLEAGIDVIQLHGQESADFAREVAVRGEVWKALRLEHDTAINLFQEYPATRFLIDAVHPVMPGGTGQVADWRLARQAVIRLSAPVLLAGGLSPENLADAVAAVGPWGVDVSTGVEDAPGIKNHHLVNSFLTIAKMPRAT